MDGETCLKCGTADGGTTRPVWRGATIFTPPLCATCCMELLALLEANPAAVKFMEDLQAKAQLAFGSAGGSA
jgi:hypothetical protein